MDFYKSRPAVLYPASNDTLTERERFCQLVIAYRAVQSSDLPKQSSVLTARINLLSLERLYYKIFSRDSRLSDKFQTMAERANRLHHFMDFYKSHPTWFYSAHFIGPEWFCRSCYRVSCITKLQFPRRVFSSSPKEVLALLSQSVSLNQYFINKIVWNI